MHTSSAWKHRCTHRGEFAGERPKHDTIYTREVARGAGGSEAWIRGLFRDEPKRRSMHVEIERARVRVCTCVIRVYVCFVHTGCNAGNECY